MQGCDDARQALPIARSCNGGDLLQVWRALCDGQCNGPHTDYRVTADRTENQNGYAGVNSLGCRVIPCCNQPDAEHGCRCNEGDHHERLEQSSASDASGQSMAEYQSEGHDDGGRQDCDLN